VENVLILTSMESVFEGVSIEDSETLGGAKGEASLILIEADRQDLLFLSLFSHVRLLSN